VLARRAQLGRLADTGKRIGYLILLLAIVAFVIGAIRGFTGPVVQIVVVSLGVSSVLLAPAIVLGYAVRAADREDREGTVREDAQPPGE
jgi:hypothetical protein